MKKKGEGVMKKRMNKGFTLVELVVVMVIVGILAVISVPMYRNYVQRARSSEGRSLVGAVASAERVFFTEFGSFYATGGVVANDATLGVDAGNNTYYQGYETTVQAGPGFTVVTLGLNDAAGVDVTLVQGAGGGPTVTVAGL